MVPSAPSPPASLRLTARVHSRAINRQFWLGQTMNSDVLTDRKRGRRTQQRQCLPSSVIPRNRHGALPCLPSYWPSCRGARRSATSRLPLPACAVQSRRQANTTDRTTLGLIADPAQPKSGLLQCNVARWAAIGCAPRKPHAPSMRKPGPLDRATPNAKLWRQRLASRLVSTPPE